MHIIAHQGIYDIYNFKEEENMICPKCGSQNVNVQMIQTEGKTKKKGNGVGGHMNNAARGITAVCTFGLSNLVWKKSRGGEKTTFKNESVCICQNCGNSWKA